MSAAEQAARAIAGATGRRLTMFAAQAWSSPTMSGQHMLIEVDGDLPANVEQIEPDVPGFALIDMAQITARRAEVLLAAVQ